MKVVLALGWYFPQPVGGTEVYVAALARRLRAAGHMVKVAAPLAGLAAPRLDEHEGVEVLRFPVPANPTRAEAQGEVEARGGQALAAWLAEERPDVFHLHTVGLGLGTAALAAARAGGARCFVTAHESRLGHLCQRGTLLRDGLAACDGVVTRQECARCVLLERGLPPTLAAVVARVPAPLGALAARLPGRAATALSMGDLVERNRARQRELVRLVDRLVVLTEAARAMVVREGAPADKVVVNRLGIDCAPPHRPIAPPSPPAGARWTEAEGSRSTAAGGPRSTEAAGPRSTGRPLRVGYLGRFDRVKGLHVLAAALVRIPQGVPIRVELRGLVRDDAQRAVADEVRRLAGGDARLTIGPEVPRAEVPALLAGWDALCCPSLCHEGGPTVALEAFAAGTPVVGSRIGGLAELVDERWGALVPPNDPAALAALLARMAQGPAATVERWRPALPSPRTMDAVFADTLAMYEGR